MKLKISFLFLSIAIIACFSACEKETSVETGAIPPVTDTGAVGGTAKYSLDGGTGNCTGAVVAGTYTAGTALSATNTATIQVTVDSIGTYSITSSSTNGISFSGSGSFTATGPQTIILSGSGTPSAGGSFNFSFGSGGCSFPVIVASAPVVTTGDFRAKIEGAQWVGDRIAQGARIGGVINLTGIGSDKRTVTMTLKDSGVHQYTLAWDNTSGSAGALVDSNLTDVTAFTTNDGLSPSDCGGTVNITSIDEVNKTMSGTFSFKAIRQIDGTSRTITEGSFTNIPYITTLPPTTSDTLRVKINDTAFAAISVTGISVFGSINLSGTDNVGSKTIGLSVPDNVAVGTYAIGSLGDPYYGQYNPNASTFLSSTGGSITILEHNPVTKKIRGNFNFSASELAGTSTAEITEGYFSITYL